MKNSNLSTRSMFLRYMVGLAIWVVVMSRIAGAQVTMLHVFPISDGVASTSSLIQASDGNFYGTTDYTVFRMTPAGDVTVMHVFNSGTDGVFGRGALIQASDGNFYGTTEIGGANGKGTIFRMTPMGTFTVMHNFFGGTDGARPLGGLIQAIDGNLYGITQMGGINNVGTIFRMTLAGTITVLHAFAGISDGLSPAYPLIQATDGNFYGATTQGGPGGAGTVFRMTPTGTFTLLHAFTEAPPDGGYPYGALIQASDGNFYGMTTQGGDAGWGTVFKMTLGGTLTTVHSFSLTDGGQPNGALIQATDGFLYGTTTEGGANGDGGTIFKITLTGALTTLFSFTDDGTVPSYPYGSMIQAIDGDFYGFSNGMDTSIYQGEVFRFRLPGATPVGANVTVQSGNTSITYDNVSTAGITTATPIDPNSAGALPGGFALTTPPLAFEISTTANVTPPITICFYVPSVNDSEEFSSLRVLHNEGGTLVDRTVLPPDSPAPDFAARTVCARVSSLSPFVIARLVNSPPEAALYYLHGSGPNNNPPTIFIDSSAPAAATAKYRDSAAININNGNTWKEIGVWTVSPAPASGMLTALSDAQVWLGLKNSDDQGTRFDLRAEIYKNGILAASGETYCVQGVTRNPSMAKEVAIPFGSFPPVTFNGATDVMSMKILTRIGTNGAGGSCGGHSNAVGLRLYFDATSRSSKFGATF